MDKKNHLIKTFAFISIISILAEILFSGDSIFKFGWLSSPISFFYIISILFFTYLLILSASNSANIARIGIIFALLSFSLISKIKFYYRASPLFFSDIKLLKELNKISSNINYSFAFKAIVAYIIISAILIYITLKFKRKHLSLSGNMRLFFSIISVFFILLLTKYDTLALSKIDCNSSYLTGFISSIPIFPEDHVCIEKINFSCKENIETTTPSETSISCTSNKPNIIVIMSEAFLDIERDNTNLYSEDIYKNFNAIRNQSKYGYLESPEFGGGTSNCEFEMLTGIPVHVFPNGEMIYEEEIKSNTPSLATALKKNGYSTLAIHPYEKWFWNRSNVYPLLGFDDFISIDKMENPDQLGYYVSDSYAFDVIKENIISTEEPLFTFLVTIQNHGPYNDDRYGDESLEINIPVSSKEKQILNTYGLGIKHSDEALGDLVEFLQNNEEDSVLMFFGDHLPMLDEEQHLYDVLGFKESIEHPNKTYRKMYSVPFFIWEKNKCESEYLGYKDMIFATPILLNYLNINMNDYFNLLLKKSKDIDYINRRFVYTTDKKLFFNEEKEYKKFNSTFSIKNSY